MALVPPGLWYRHARALELVNGITNFGVTRSPAQLLAEWQMPRFWLLNFTQHPFDVWVFPGVSVLVLLVALVRLRQRAVSRPLVLLGVTELAYVFLCGYSGAHHDYYGLIQLPLLSIAGGRALAVASEWVSSRWRRGAPWVVAGFVLVAMGWQVRRGSGWWPQHGAEWKALAEFSERTWGPPGPNRVVVFSNGSPQLFWWSHQHGAFGDLAAPSVPPSRVGLVDRLRLKAQAVPVEAALTRQGCTRVFENEVAFVCQQPP
jgi:hypothetical protein